MLYSRSIYFKSAQIIWIKNLRRNAGHSRIQGFQKKSLKGVLYNLIPMCITMYVRKLAILYKQKRYIICFPYLDVAGGSKQLSRPIKGFTKILSSSYSAVKVRQLPPSLPQLRMASAAPFSLILLGSMSTIFPLSKLLKTTWLGRFLWVKKAIHYILSQLE